jgi:signal peptidase I
MAWPPGPWESLPGYPQQGAWENGAARAGVASSALPGVTQLELEAPTAPAGANRWEQAGNVVREIVETLVLTFAIFLLIRIPFQNFRIEGYSMEPTLHSGQYLIVNKALYRWISAPKRGDIIVLEPPRDRDRDYIKRVIGLPGELVEVKQGRVYINGKPLAEDYLTRLGSYTTQPVTLGPEEYYVLGDNRDNSNDSHSWGPLPRSNIVGKAWISYWPPKDWGLVPSYSFASSEP